MIFLWIRWNRGRSLATDKLEGLKDLINSAIHGVLRIANEFNIDMQRAGRIISIANKTFL
jgi:hypothetical protein